MILHCLVFVSESSKVIGLGPGARIDVMIKAVSSLHCLVFLGASSSEQSGHLQVPGSRRHVQGCVIIALPCLCRRQLQRAVGSPSGARIDDMIKAVSSLHCLVFVGASSKEQSGYRQVPASTS